MCGYHETKRCACAGTMRLRGVHVLVHETKRCACAGTMRLRGVHVRVP